MALTVRSIERCAQTAAVCFVVRNNAPGWARQTNAAASFPFTSRRQVLRCGRSRGRSCHFAALNSTMNKNIPKPKKFIRSCEITEKAYSRAVHTLSASNMLLQLDDTLQSHVTHTMRRGEAIAYRTFQWQNCCAVALAHAPPSRLLSHRLACGVH